MPSSGVERRNLVDTETFKGLLVINGGASLAMVASLAPLLQLGNVRQLLAAVLIPLGCYQTGLVFAIVHNRLRRKCSAASEKQPRERCEHGWVKAVFARNSEKFLEPCVCHESIACFWASVFSFVFGCAVLLVGGLLVLAPVRVSRDDFGVLRHW